LKRKNLSILSTLVLVISLGLAMAVPVLAAPTATFSPTSGPVGTSVTVSGTGWAASEAISSVTVGLVNLGGVTATYSATHSLTVNASGNLSGTITIPTVAGGAQNIIITGATSGPQIFTGAFTVTTPTETFSLTSGPVIMAIAVVLILLILLIVLFMSLARRRAQKVTRRATRPSLAPSAGLTCPKCQAKLPAGTKFCSRCGMNLLTPPVCPSCGAQVPEGAKFCSRCGKIPSWQSATVVVGEKPIQPLPGPSPLRKDMATITAGAGPGGSVSPSGAVTVNYGADQAFTITPDVGYHIADVLIDGSSVGVLISYTFTKVTANHTVVVTFATDASDMKIIPDRVKPGGIVNIFADAINTGSEMRTYRMVLKVRGTVESVKEVTLDPGQSQKVVFTILKGEPGVYDVDFGGLKGSFTVES